MTEKELKKQMREEVKKEGGKIVFSNQFLQLSLYPTNETRRYYVSKAALDEENNVLNVESFLMKRHGHHLWSILSVVDYWVKYAQLNQCKQVIMSKKLFIESGFYSSSHKFNEDYIQCVLAQGFEKKEDSYVLDVKNYADIRVILKKITAAFEEKKQNGEAIKITEQEKVVANGVYKGIIEWKGHKADIDICYKREDQTLHLKDSKNVTIEASVEEVEQLIENYFKKVDQLRKIKNIYEPPTDNIKRLLNNVFHIYAINAGEVMKQFMEFGYRYDEIENHAFCLTQDVENLRKRVSNLRFFGQEAIFKFLNHYVMFIVGDKNEGHSKVFSTKEELFAYYKKITDETLQKRIEDSKEKIKEIG